VAVLLIVLELTTVCVPVVQYQFSNCCTLAHLEDSLVSVAVRECHDACSVLHAVQVFTFESGSVQGLLCALPIGKAVLESAFVGRTISLDRLAKSLLPPHVEISLKSVTCRVPLLAMAMRNAVLPASFILLATLHHHFALTVTLSHVEIAFVDITIGKDQITPAMGHTILGFASINVTALSSNRFWSFCHISRFKLSLSDKSNPSI